MAVSYQYTSAQQVWNNLDFAEDPASCVDVLGSLPLRAGTKMSVLLGFFCCPTEIHGEIDWGHSGVPCTYLTSLITVKRSR